MKITKYKNKGEANALERIDEILKHSNINGSNTFVKNMLIGPYRIALLNLRFKIAIDLDDTSSEKPGYKHQNSGRDTFLSGLGYKVIRFTENQLYSQPDHVLRVIEEAVESYGKQS